MRSPGPDCRTRRVPEAPVRWRNDSQRSAPKRITQRSVSARWDKLVPCLRLSYRPSVAKAVRCTICAGAVRCGNLTAAEMPARSRPPPARAVPGMHQVGNAQRVPIARGVTSSLALTLDFVAPGQATVSGLGATASCNTAVCEIMDCVDTTEVATRVTVLGAGRLRVAHPDELSPTPADPDLPRHRGSRLSDAARLNVRREQPSLCSGPGFASLSVSGSTTRGDAG